MPSNLEPTLGDRVHAFLSTVRVGIDFGEHTGGIAIVRGNEVLHAETVLDFHEATLEQRRLLRRGRRGRHAKKMRLARLRSWILRQQLPNGDRLPDPYEIMRRRKYMAQPGVFESKGTSPQDAPSWVSLAQDGKTDAAGFVRALTLIFQRRGYKWDAIALEEMPDAKMKDFLLNARIPAGNTGLADEVKLQIERRRADSTGSFRGKSKVSVEELEGCFLRALERGKKPPRPRLAEHRSVKESDLRAVVEGFGKSASLARETIDRWKWELAGGNDARGISRAGLLNKVLRPARFDNRLRTGCAWCGKATPRKARVRELAYRAAVNNLRARENFRPRPLNESEKQVFLDWWSKRETAPGPDAIKARIKKLNPDQDRMARQFHDLLQNEKPKGRASLCQEHLAMAAQGKTMRDAGVDWQRIAVRKAPNPCGERHDARVMRRLENLLFNPLLRGDSAWRYGPVSYISLEIPDPGTEQLGKGKQADRKTDTLTERLAAETDGCAYKVLGSCAGGLDKDHIFPQSKGGPDVRMNLVAACAAHNKEKDNRTPHAWLASEPGRWSAFEQYVQKLGVPERKKIILLNKTPEYPPGDPSPLARIGARPRQFAVLLGKLFAKYDVPLPRVDYRLGETLIQRISGGETHAFRLSWCKKPDGSNNFPYPKHRSSTFNHAEDAAILAAMPPHTWREQVRCWRAERPNAKGEWLPRPGLALPELAPDWAAYLQKRNKPIVYVLGRYPVRWRGKFADLTFWLQPENKDAPRLKRYKQVRNLKQPDFRNVVSDAMRARVERIASEVAYGGKGTISEALARRIAGPEVKKASEVQQKIPEAVEQLETTHPELRRVQVFSQKGGTMAQVRPSDGPMRLVQIKPATDGLVVWRKWEGKKKKSLKTYISLIRPHPLRVFGLPRLHPPIRDAERILGQLHRHQIIWLQGRPDRSEGFYRVTKCQRGGATVVPEELVPAEIANREGLKLQKEPMEGGDGTGDGSLGTISLGKRDLEAYFLSRKEKNAE